MTLAPATEATLASLPHPAAGDDGGWCGPGREPRRGGGGRWARLLWLLVYPPRDQRVYPTLSGVILMSLSMAIGTAAYNTSNNILFLTLSLLLACLILSGVLSWMNLARVSWRLVLEPGLRVGRETLVVLEVRNGKRALPTYGLRFDVKAGGEAAKPVALMLTERLEAGGGRTKLEWSWKPERRGKVPVALTAVGSLFPFGFLRKTFPGGVRLEAVVWPAPVAYQRLPAGSALRPLSGRRVARLGQSGDLLALRRYAPGDSHRLIHWKATARTGQLLVRQFAAESEEGFTLWIDTAAGRWTRPEQFELLVGFAASLAEDLFAAGRLESVAIDAEPSVPVRRVRDLETVLDRLAVLEPRATDTAPGAGASPAGRRRTLVFVPDGPRGVLALLDGQPAAAA
jgi:uncharacterized protein (DUF58 family)